MELAYLFDPNKQFQDRNGVNNVAGFLRVYYEGTDDRAKTYKNFIGTLNPADIPIDNDGRAVVIVEGEKTYRLEVYTRNGNLLWTQHPLCPLVGGGGSFEQVQSNWKEEDPTSAAFIKNKPNINNGRIHRLRPARDEVIGETSNYDGWVLDLESPNESAPGGYDRLTPQRLKQILDNGEFLVLETYQSGAYVPLALQALVTVHNENPLQISVDFVRQYESYNLLGFERMQIYTPIGEESYLQIRGLGPNSSWWQDKEALAINGDGKDVTVTFSEASARTNISTGEKLSVLFGKIKKFFTDLASVAFSGSYNDLSDKPSIPAAQVNSDWDANSGVAQILNKPDLTQYIPSSQKGSPNGVGSLGSNSVQPYSEQYKGYTVEGDAVFKLCRIPKDATYAAGVSFVFTCRAYNKASGQVLLWISPCEHEDSNVVYKVVNLFSRANDVTMQFFYDEVTVDGSSYVDVYYRVYGSSHTHVMPLWMRSGVLDMLSTEPVTLPANAVEMTSRFFNVCAAKGGVGSASIPVYINNAGNAVACTMATVASTGRYSDLLDKPDLTRVISSDGSDPMSEPPIAGITFINKSTHDIWYASGTTSASDWTLIYNRNHDLICQQKPIVISGSTTMRYILCDRQKYTIENGAYVFAPVDIYELAKWINRGDVIQIDGAVATDPWGDRYPMQITEMQCSLDSGTNKIYCTNIGVRGYAYSQTEITRWGDTIVDEATNKRYLEFTNWT